MSYFVQVLPRVSDYLDAIEGLSAAGRAALADGIVEELGRDADRFLTLHATGHESLHFRYDYLQPDSDAHFNFEFVIDGTRMAVGVVTVVFVECERVPRHNP